MVEQLAAVVRRLRTERGLSLRGLAARAHVDVAYLSRIENAGYDMPNPLYLRAVAEALDVPADDLLLAAGYRLASDLPSPEAYLATRYDLRPSESAAFASDLEDLMAARRPRSRRKGN
jgi:HTH-type transcriptional repressor of puuD